MEDSAIIDMFFKRDERAITEVDNKFGNTLRNLSKRLTGSFEDAEECLNDTYMTLWNKIPPDHPDFLLAYICRITRYISLARYRRNSAQKRNAVTFSLENEFTESLSAGEDFTESLELTEIINNFLEKLDKESRLLFMRRYYYADSLSELSGISGMKENAIAARLFRMRKKLGDILKKEGYEL